MTEKISDKQKKDMALAMFKAMGIEVDPTLLQADVVRGGSKIILPDDVEISEIVESLQRKDKEEKQVIRVKTDVAVPPWDGAMALQKAMTQEFGIVIHNETFSWLTGRVPPQEMEVEVEYGKTVTIKWGEFSLPSLGGDAIVRTAVEMNDEGEMTFQCVIECKRRFQARARKLLDVMRHFAMTESIHKGKAFSMNFHDAQGHRLPLPMPKFFDLNAEQPIFRKDLEEAIERNIFVPLRHTDALRKMGKSLKRGVLFAGEFGVGKTMLATYIANVASQNGWTFLYAKEPHELPLALKLAIKYQPVVVFGEDVDRIAGIERTAEVNNLLNQLDGLDAKNSQIMTLITTNDMNKISPAMRRPGRIDLVLRVLAPDEDTIGRMVPAFSNYGLEDGIDLSGIQKELAGLAPAYVREAVDRARLEALRRTGDPDALVSGKDLQAVAAEVRAEKEMFSKQDPVDLAGPLAVARGFRAAADVITKVNGGESGERIRAR